MQKWETAREDKDVCSNMTTINPKKRRIDEKQEYGVIIRT